MIGGDEDNEEVSQCKCAILSLFCGMFNAGGLNLLEALPGGLLSTVE